MVRVQCLCVCVCDVRSSVSEHLRLGGRFVATPHREACAVKGAGRVRPGNWSAGWYLRHSGDGVKYVVGLSETYLTTAIFPAPHTRTTRRARHDSVRRYFTRARADTRRGRGSGWRDAARHAGVRGSGPQRCANDASGSGGRRRWIHCTVFVLSHMDVRDASFLTPVFRRNNASNAGSRHLACTRGGRGRGRCQ